MKLPFFLILLLLNTITIFAQDYIDCEIFQIENTTYYSQENYQVCKGVEDELQLDQEKMETYILNNFLSIQKEVDQQSFENFFEYSNFKYNESIENITKTNSTYIIEAFIKVPIVNPAIYNPIENIFVIPENITAKVEYDFNRDLIIEDEFANKYPDETSKGYCKEEYSLSFTEEANIYLDETLIDANIKKINITSIRPGFHDLKSTYTINANLFGDYTNWESYCCSRNSEGTCTKTCYDCPDSFDTREDLSEELFLTDTQRLFFEDNFSESGLTVFKEGNQEYVTLRIPSANIDRKFSINTWFNRNNYDFDFIEMYHPKKIILASVKENKYENTANFNIEELKENEFTFPISKYTNEINIHHTGFFNDNIETLIIKDKNLSFVGGVFDMAYYVSDEIIFYPYIFTNETKCGNCGVIIDTVEVRYNNQSYFIQSNQIEKENGVEITKVSGNNCVYVYYKGDENYYSSNKCVYIPHYKGIYNGIKIIIILLLIFSFFKLLINKGVKGKWLLD